MLNLLSNLRPQRRPAALRLLALLLASLVLAGAPAGAAAQSIMQQPQTKEEAQQAQEAQDTSTSTSGNSDRTIQIGLLVLGIVVLGGAAWYIVRDSGDAVGDSQRDAPRRPLDERSTGRGAPKTMFTGEAEPGGKVGKRKRRDVGKRQKQARKANRR